MSKTILRALSLGIAVFTLLLIGPGGGANARPVLPGGSGAIPLVRYVSDRVPVQGPGVERAAERPQSLDNEVAPPQASTPLTNSWQLIATLPGAVVKDVSFPTPLIGYAAAELGQVWKTTDAGAHWNLIVNLGFPYYWYGVHAMDANTVVISGFNDNNFNGMLRWSTDGGATWTPDQVLTTHGWSYRTRFADALHGLVLDGVDTQSAEPRSLHNRRRPHRGRLDPCGAGPQPARRVVLEPVQPLAQPEGAHLGDHLLHQSGRGRYLGLRALGRFGVRWAGILRQRPRRVGWGRQYLAFGCRVAASYYRRRDHLEPAYSLISLACARDSLPGRSGWLGGGR